MDTKILNENVKKVYVLFNVVDGVCTIRAISVDLSSLEHLKADFSRVHDDALFRLKNHFFIEEYENFIFNPQN